jgi:hypothetical protein
VAQKFLLYIFPLLIVPYAAASSVPILVERELAYGLVEKKRK